VRISSHPPAAGPRGFRTVSLAVGGRGVGIGWNHGPFGIRILIFYRLLGDRIERRAKVGVVGRGGFDGLVSKQVGAGTRAIESACSMAQMTTSWHAARLPIRTLRAIRPTALALSY
jgi:hypothetical protein